MLFLIGVEKFIKEWGGEETSSISAKKRALFALTGELEEQLVSARSTLGNANTRQPLFGILYCIRMVLGSFGPKDVDGELTAWSTKMVSLSEEVSGIVGLVLNSDSPEGHVIGDASDPQTLLLCSWRSSKEVSHLLAALVTLGLLSGEQTRSVARFFVDLLGATVHRGAFEQAYAGFSTICGWMWSKQEHFSFLNQLLEDSLNSIIEKERSFSTTRLHTIN